MKIPGYKFITLSFHSLALSFSKNAWQSICCANFHLNAEHTGKHHNLKFFLAFMPIPHNNILGMMHSGISNNDNKNVQCPHAIILMYKPGEV